MATAFIHLALILSSLCPTAISVRTDALSKCLPPGINLDSNVANEPSEPDKQLQAKGVTVKAKLSHLKARCKRGKLLDSKGRQIRVYTLIGCWGNPPDNYLELLENQDREIQRLKKRYTVIQIPCGHGSVDLRSMLGQRPFLVSK